LRDLGVCSTGLVATTPTDDLAALFGHHLKHHQGLADSSIERYREVARQFLVERFSRGAVDMSTVAAVDVIGFVQRQAKRLKPPAVKCFVNGMLAGVNYLAPPAKVIVASQDALVRSIRPVSRRCRA
jgi:hypothetical protein